MTGHYAPDTLTPARDWRTDTACRDENPELFFPTGNTGPALLQIEEAKAVCRRCPVMEACLQWALDTGQEHGVWGGLSEDERRALKRREARKVRSAPQEPPPCGSLTAYRRHIRMHERIDDACRLAHNRDQLDRYHASKTKTA